MFSDDELDRISARIIMSTKPAIKFYTALSPNGFKVGIALEELGLPYECIAVNLPELEHKEEWFLKINPNGRIPALTDTLADGTSINLWETACILQYLIDRYDTEHKFSYPRGTKEYYQTSIWVSNVRRHDQKDLMLTLLRQQLSFQIASIGPIQGQAFHFCHYNHATTPQDYAVDRYVNELRRCYRVMDTHLAEAGSPYLVGDKPTVADWAVFPWASSSGEVLSSSLFSSLWLAYPPLLIVDLAVLTRFCHGRFGRVPESRGVVRADEGPAGCAEGDGDTHQNRHREDHGRSRAIQGIRRAERAVDSKTDDQKPGEVNRQRNCTSWCQHPRAPASERVLSHPSIIDDVICKQIVLPAAASPNPTPVYCFVAVPHNALYTYQLTELGVYGSLHVLDSSPS